jgi:hypothetical protein
MAITNHQTPTVQGVSPIPTVFYFDPNDAATAQSIAKVVQDAYHGTVNVRQKDALGVTAKGVFRVDLPERP